MTAGIGSICVDLFKKKMERRLRSHCKCVKSKTFKCPFFFVVVVFVCTKSKTERIKKKERRKQVAAGTGSESGASRGA